MMFYTIQLHTVLSFDKKKHLFTLWHWTPKIEFMEK